MSLYKRFDSKYWWLSYSVRGRLVRESTGTDSEAEARHFEKLRRDQLGAAALGLRKFSGPTAERMTVGELMDALAADFRIRELKSLPESLNLIEQTRAAFGQYKAKEITADVVNGWVLREKAQPEHLSNATINRRITMLGQALKIGHERGYTGPGPKLIKLSELGNVRQGFFEHWEVEALIASAPDYLKDFIRFGSLTGWRKGEIASLTWADVDMAGKVIRLRAEHSKNAHGRTLALEGELWSVIGRRTESRPVSVAGSTVLSEFVFHLHGQPIGDIRKSWFAACKASGIGRKLFHDLRRTAIRNMVRAGVHQTVAMSISGHRTPSVFCRYAIVDEADSRAALNRVQDHLSEQPSERKVIAIS